MRCSRVNNSAMTYALAARSELREHFVHLDELLVLHVAGLVWSGLRRLDASTSDTSALLLKCCCLLMLSIKVSREPISPVPCFYRYYLNTGQTENSKIKLIVYFGIYCTLSCGTHHIAVCTRLYHYYYPHQRQLALHKHDDSNQDDCATKSASLSPASHVSDE